MAQYAPKTSETTPFSKVTYENCPLYIRTDAVNYDFGHWGKFKNVIKFTPDNVSAIDSEQEDVHVYSLDGLRLNTPRHGVNNLQKSDGSARKVVVK